MRTLRTRLFFEVHKRGVDKMNSYSNYNPYSTTSYGSNGPANGGGFYGGGGGVVVVEEEERVSMIMPEAEQEGLEVLAVLQRSVTHSSFLVFPSAFVF